MVQGALLGHLKSVSSKPDEVISEGPRKGEELHVFEDLAWVAYDRATKSAAEIGMKGPVEEWEARRRDSRRGVPARL